MGTVLAVAALISFLILLVSWAAIPEIFQEIGGKIIIALAIAPVWVAAFAISLLLWPPADAWTGRFLVGLLIVAAFFLLLGLSETFGRRVLRVSAISMFAIGGAWAFWPSWPRGDPAWLDGAPQGGWAAAVAIAIAGAYLWLERITTKEPRVHVAEPTPDDNEATRLVLNELRLRLPAIEVSAPAWKPGGEPGEAVATLVESSGFRGNKLVSAVTRLFSRVVQIPSYTVRVRVHESVVPRPDGEAPGGDRLVSVTVDVHETITGKSEHQITLPPLRLDAAATRAAGFVASRIFLNDPSTREWAKARFDGEDLSAYLTVKSPFTCWRSWKAGERDYAHDYDPHREERRRCIGLLERVASSRRVAGVVRYELASLYELEGEHVKALRLHALNRAQFQTDPFERSRYRMVVLLKMIAGHDFADMWTRATEADRHDIFHAFETARIYPPGKTFPAPPADSVNTTPTEQEFAADPGDDPCEDSLLRVRLVLLHIAAEEARRFEKHQSWPRLACEMLLEKKKSRNRTLTAEDDRDENLTARYRFRKRNIKILEESIDARIALAAHRPPEQRGSASGKLWKKPPPKWNELYNQACLRAVQEVEPFCDESVPVAGDKEASVSRVVDTLRAALHPSVCDHYRPSELLLVDPDLRCLRGSTEFDRLVEEQLRRDWGPAGPQARPESGDRLLDDWVVQRMHRAWSDQGARG